MQVGRDWTKLRSPRAGRRLVGDSQSFLHAPPYRDTHANELLGRCYTEVIERAGIPASEVEDVVAGCVQQYGEQSWNVGRNAWL